MRKLLIALFLLAQLHAFAQSYTPVASASSVTFTIKNFGLQVEGIFGGLRGNISFDEANLEASSFDVTIDAATIDTGIDMRDSHLKKKEYFDVDSSPIIRFRSTQVSKTSKEGFSATGELTMKGITKKLTLPFSVSKQGGSILFEGQVTLNRRDYKVGGGSMSMSDEVTVFLKVVGKPNS